ncbi:MAG TPA: ImmA/IrrE family metallo-endopeptidase [Galbitalea sp.]|nr:ImmA/IrrE family metallo-endopeptidase [Galbitalea sp.]
MNANPSAHVLARVRVGERAELMLEIAARRSAGVLERLRLDTINEMRSWDDLTLVSLDPAAIDSRCGIAGIYVDTVSPPRIGISRDASRRRAAFTALHEFGHHLQRTEDQLVDQLGEQPDLGRSLEEMSCDAFAAAVLLPRERLTAELDSAIPTAVQVASLWRANAASRAAVCVAASGRLHRPGHVVLLNTDGTVEFSTSYIEFPLRRGGDQSQTEIFRAFAGSSSTAVSARTRFFYRPPYRGPELYTQAVALDGYVLVVAVSDGAPWEKLALSSRTPTVLGGWHTCVNCGEVFKSWDQPCDICNAIRCPECGRCECPSRVAERQCTECFLIKPAHQFVGESKVCIDH